MRISEILKHAEKFITDNSPLILSAGAVTGVVMTGIFASRAGYKAGRIISEMEITHLYPDDITTKAKVKAVWPLYIPTVATAATTIACVVMTNRITTKRATALAAAYTLSEKVIEEYKEKVVEKFGASKEREVHDSIAQDHVSSNPVTKQEVIISASGEELCYDMYSGRYFKSSMNDLKKAQNDLNGRILNHMYASLNDFYNYLGLDNIKIGEEVGWNSDRLIELTFSTTLSDDDKPCITVDFDVTPIRGYFLTH